jgi:sugar O-acyltransferase (sialic acid O-acetyltransferase NeuD family)
LGIPYLGSDDVLKAKKAPGAVIAMAGAHILKVRIHLTEQLLKLGYQLPIICSPSAFVASSATLGPGTIVMEQAVVNPGAVVGMCGVINTGAIVEHDNIIGDFVHIAPGVTLCGDVKVGQRSFIGANSVVRPGITITEDVTIGAGSVVVKDIIVAGLFGGNPAKVFKGAENEK